MRMQAARESYLCNERNSFFPTIHFQFYFSRMIIFEKNISNRAKKIPNLINQYGLNSCEINKVNIIRINTMENHKNHYLRHYKQERN